MSDQLSLFGEPAEGSGASPERRRRREARAADAGSDGAERRPSGAADPAREALERRFDQLRPIAARLPDHVRFGTSSWSFPGWAGIVYPRGETASVLARGGLREYVRHPLLTTVGIDRSYYAPIPDADLRRYAEQLPPDFPCCAKAPAAVTSTVLPVPGGRSRQPNPDFLSAERFVRDLIGPFDRGFRPNTGPFILQFPPAPKALRLGATEFADRLDRFLEALPPGFQYAVEIRQRDLLCTAYAAVLARHQAAHVYSYWSDMPTPGPQAAVLPPEAQPFVVIRLLLRPGATYEEQREAFAPFDRIQAESQSMRDEVVGILSRAVGRRLPAFVLVNNKAEGSAPLTIEGLARRVVDSR